VKSYICKFSAWFSFFICKIPGKHLGPPQHKYTLGGNILWLSIHTFMHLHFHEIFIKPLQQVTSTWKNKCIKIKNTSSDTISTHCDYKSFSSPPGQYFRTLWRKYDIFLASNFLFLGSGDSHIFKIWVSEGL